VKTLNTNDFTDGATTTLGNAFRIFFDTGAPSFTIRGGGIKVFDFGGNRARIQNDSTNLQTIALRRVGSGNAAGGLDINANPGDIILNCQDTTFFDDTPTPTKQASQLRFDGNAGRVVTYNARIQDGNTTASLAIRSNTIVILTVPNNS